MSEQHKTFWIRLLFSHTFSLFRLENKFKLFSEKCVMSNKTNTIGQSKFDGHRDRYVYKKTKNINKDKK
jgi:hypothetical protein